MMLATLALFQEHAATEGGLPAPFRLEPGLMVWTWIVFGGLLLLLWKFAWPSIVRLTEERERTSAKHLQDAERASKEAHEALEEHQRLVAGAKEQAQTVINDAKAFAQKEREALLEKARQEYDQLLDRAKRDIAHERDKAVAQLKREAVELSLAAATKLIKQWLDADGDRRIVEDYISSVGSDLR